MHACECQNAQERDTPGASCLIGILRYGSSVLPTIRISHHAPRRAERYEKSPKTVTVGGKINRKPPKYRGIREVDTA